VPVVANINFTKVMMDDSTMDVSKEVGMVMSIANTLRGPYHADKYKDVIIPMIIIRRLECALQIKGKDGKTKQQKVAEMYKKNKKTPKQVLENLAGYPFYNTSDFTLKNLLDEAPAIVENFTFYIDSFSANIQDILVDKLKFKEEIKKLDKNNRLLGVVKKFSELDLNPETIDGHKMGYMFEEIIRRFSENAEAGDHYTPREVIRMLTSILLAEGADDIFGEGKEITVLDMACGSGGMLSTTHDFIKRMNPDATVRLFGQENNPESYSICLADMLIKNQSADNIRYQDTMKKDCFEEQSMRFVIANPPFGQSWGGKDAADGVEKAVRDEYKKGKNGRFAAGLPATGDMQLLFMQHAIAKMDENNGRAAIITNGSPLFSGNTTSGESQIRRMMLERDLVEAIIALPSQLFYNTDIGIYAFILSKNKAKRRTNKIQLIDATDMWEPLKRSLGKKRREISKKQIAAITKAYAEMTESVTYIESDRRKENGEAHKCKLEVKIFDRDDFLYKEYFVYQPLQRRAVIDAASIEALRTSAYFTANSNLFNENDFEELEQTNPRDAKAEKKYQKYIRGRQFAADVIAALSAHASDKVYMDYSKFEATLKKILKEIEGYSDSRLTGIAMEMSVMDKTAVVQKNRKGETIVDPTTKDTEIIALSQDPEEYMKAEVYPYVPDAIWRYEFKENKAISASNKERLGAEFPFTRFFYEYHEPEKADDLLAEFMELEASLSEKIAALQKGAN
jgi:type I restriction enzyme M protein